MSAEIVYGDERDWPSWMADAMSKFRIRVGWWDFWCQVAIAALLQYALDCENLAEEEFGGRSYCATDYVRRIIETAVL